ncbi:Os08g0300300, partial [Oryza sativa Japonica Group]
PHDLPPQGHPHRRPHRRDRRHLGRPLQLPHDEGPARLQRDQREGQRAQAASGGGGVHPDVVLRVRPAVAGAVPAVPDSRGAVAAERDVPFAEPIPAVPLPGGALQRLGQPLPQHQRRRHPQPLLHGHQRRLPPGLHARLFRRLLRARRAQLRRRRAVGAVRPHHPHRRHLRPPRRHAARRPLRTRPRPRRHPRLRLLPRRHAPDDGVRVRHHPGAHQQPAPPPARHARAAHLQDRRRLLQLQHLRPHPQSQGPPAPRRPRRAVHAAAHRRRRGGRAAAELQRRREGGPHRAHAPDHGAPRVPGGRRAALLAGTGAVRPRAARAPAGTAQEAGVPDGAGAVPQGLHGREVRGAGLRQARVREAGHHRRRGAVAGGDGDVRRPAPLHQHVAVHGGGDHVAGQGARPLPRGRPATPPRRAQVLRQVAGGGDPDEARLHAGAHPRAAPGAGGKPVEAAPVAEGRRRQEIPVAPRLASQRQRLIDRCRGVHYIDTRTYILAGQRGMMMMECLHINIRTYTLDWSLSFCEFCAIITAPIPGGHE